MIDSTSIACVCDHRGKVLGVTATPDGALTAQYRLLERAVQSDHPFWKLVTSAERERVREAFGACLTTGDTQSIHVVGRSNLTWHARQLRLGDEAMVLVFCELEQTPSNPRRRNCGLRHDEPRPAAPTARIRLLQPDVLAGPVARVASEQQVRRLPRCDPIKTPVPAKSRST